jgi:hypothetical protein
VLTLSNTSPMKGVAATPPICDLSGTISTISWSGALPVVLHRRMS